MTRMLYAYVELREWGQPNREHRVGPFSPEDERGTDDDIVETLRSNLEARGEIVNRVEVEACP